LDEAPVVNASPLIHLTRAGHPELLRAVGDRIAVPRPVADEILAMGQDDVTARSLALFPWLEVVAPLEGGAAPSLLHVPLIGTLGIVLLAKRKGVISRARMVVDELVSNGMYLSPSVLDAAFALVGE
jgi:predicted nucleic acid-binding protein